MNNYRPKKVKHKILELCSFPKEWTFEDLQVYTSLLKHYKFKIHSIIGMFVWPLANFIFPFLVGLFGSLFIYGEFMLGDGIAAIMLSSFLYPVTIPFFFFMGCVIHPFVLKKLIFETDPACGPEYLYNEEIASYVSFNSHDRLLTIAAVGLSLGLK